MCKCIIRVIFHWLSEMKQVKNVFLTRRWGLGIGHVTYWAGNCFRCVRHC